MLRNLIAEMARFRVSEKDIAILLNREYRWVRKRINEEKISAGVVAQFGTLDLVKIKRSFFPSCTLEYLSESETESKSA